MTSPLAVDGATLVRFVNAADQTLANSRAAQMSVDNARDYLMRTWGGQASTEFTNALEHWQAGLNRVTQGLQAIQANVAQYRQQTSTVEESAYTDARWMPGGASWT